MSEIFFQIAHLISGCVPGKVLWRGKVDIQKGKRGSDRLIGEYTLHECLKCRQPFIHRFSEMVKVQIERREKKRGKPQSIPVAA